MGFRDNRDSVLANFAQQAAAALIFLFVPRMLGVENFGQATYVVTLLSFMTFSDFGLSFVYTRKMPAVYSRGDQSEVITWNSTVLRFRVYSAFLFAVGICAFYFGKYGEVVNTLLLFLVPPLSAVTSFYIARYTTQHNFSVTRNTNFLQAITRLSVLPGVALAGLRGWFVGQLVAALMVFGSRDLRAMSRKDWGMEVGLNWQLIRAHLPEAISLGLITTLWMQLLFSGRVFAAFIYPNSVIAQYGVAGSAYQVIASLIISAFIPQTIKVYRLLEHDRKAAVDYTFRVILWTLPIIILITAIGLAVAPVFFDFFFPKYNINFAFFMPFMLSVVNYPMIVSLGTLLVGTKRNGPYLFLIVCSLIINWVMVYLITPSFGYHSAAVAQLFSLSFYTVTLVSVIAIIFWDSISSKWPIWICLSASLLLPIVLHGILS